MQLVEDEGGRRDWSDYDNCPSYRVTPGMC